MLGHPMDKRNFAQVGVRVLPFAQWLSPDQRTKARDRPSGEKAGEAGLQIIAIETHAVNAEIA
jgi:hypothetical protein